jgi:NAD(P)-dependent dehydrogenase (short-subunit alcohol dehydrogenase family)
MNVNLTSVFLGCQVVGGAMVEQGKGAIINVSSLYGVVSPNHNIYPETGIFQPVAYSVSKHGVIAFTKYLSTLWATKGVKVNALTPGGVFNNHTDPFLERFSKLNPSGRMSRKDELRGAIVYLASDASSYVIGHNLIVDGGWTII